MAKATASVPTVSISKFRVPEHLYDIYSERAAKFGRSVEEEFVLRLRDCSTHTDPGSIYITNDTRNTLTQLAGQTIKNESDLLTWAKRQISLNVGGVDIPLTTQLADRLRSRLFGSKWEDFIRRTVTENLEREVGLR